MTTPIEDAWKDAERAARELQRQTSAVSKLANRFGTAVEEGHLKSALDELAELTTVLDLLRSHGTAAEAAIETARTAVEQPGALEDELLASFRSSFPEVAVFSSFESVVAYPVKWTVRRGATGLDLHLLGRRESSRRPSYLASVTEKELKSARPPEQFARALHRAFKALHGGGDTGRASLRTLYEVLAAVPPGDARYGIERFTAELQHLYTSLQPTEPDQTRLGLRQASFDVANAGSGIAIILADGSQIVLGSIRFDGGS